jgi:hypothetical protein
MVEGDGVTVNATTNPMEVRMPLIDSSVENRDSQANLVRGGRPRVAILRISATMHSSGRIRTSGARQIFAQTEIGDGSFAASGGPSVEQTACATSSVRMTIFSMSEP